MQHNTFTLVNDYMNLVKLVKNCVSTMKSQGAQKNLNLLGPILEKPLDKYYLRCIYGDEIRFSQIIMNFVSNAIKFTPARGLVSVSLLVTNIEDLEDASSISSPSKG